MKKIIFILLFACMSSWSHAKDGAKERFRPTERSQIATFYVTSHWIGGMGSMPILDWETKRPKDFNNLTIYFDESKAEMVRAKVPSCVVSMPLCKIKAKIHLEKKSGFIPSIEVEKTRKYYEAVADKIYSIEDISEKCE